MDFPPKQLEGFSLGLLARRILLATTPQSTASPAKASIRRLGHAQARRLEATYERVSGFAGSGLRQRQG